MQGDRHAADVFGAIAVVRDTKIGTVVAVGEMDIAQPESGNLEFARVRLGHCSRVGEFTIPEGSASDGVVLNKENVGPLIEIFDLDQDVRGR